MRAAAQRVPVIIATGRMYRSALPWCRELGATAPAVCYQGALVREMPPGGATLLEMNLEAAAAELALALAREHGWHIQAYQHDELLCEQDRAEAHLYARIAQVPITFVDDLAPLLRHGTTKLVCVVEDAAEVQRCREVMTRELGGAARVTWSLPQFVEIVNPAVSKAAACALVCERFGVDLGDALAIGDAANDIDVLDAAGYAVAVRTADSHVLDHADATCAPPADAGVADALSALGLIG